MQSLPRTASPRFATLLALLALPLGAVPAAAGDVAALVQELEDPASTWPPERVASHSLEVWSRALRLATVPLPPERARLAEILAWAAPPPAGPSLALECALRLPQPAAEQALLALAALPPWRRPPDAALCEALARVGRAASIPALARRLTAPDRDVGDAAGRALCRIRDRALLRADLHTAEAAARAVLAADPWDAEAWAGRLAVVDPHDPETDRLLADLDRRIRLSAPPAPPQERAPWARMIGVAAAVTLLRGDAEEAAARLDQALETFAPVGPIAIEAALERSRLAMLRAVTALAAGQDDAASRTLAEATLRLPEDPWEPLSDEAFRGPLGPAWLLDVLWHRGHTGFQARFFLLFENALRESVPRLAPPIEKSDGEDDRARTWATLFAAQWWLREGEAEKALEAARRLARAVGRSDLPNNHLLAAGAHLAAAQAAAALGRPDVARSEFAVAQRRFESVSSLEGAFLLRELRGRPASWAAPPRPSVEDVLALCLAQRADFEEEDAGDTELATRLREQARRRAPLEPYARLAGALADARRGRTERALLSFRSLPRRADLLFDLAHLALALGLRSQAEELFARHLATNAMTPASRELAKRRWEALLAAHGS